MASMNYIVFCKIIFLRFCFNQIVFSLQLVIFIEQMDFLVYTEELDQESSVDL